MKYYSVTSTTVTVALKLIYNKHLNMEILMRLWLTKYNLKLLKI